jgi:hypothetical protein
MGKKAILQTTPPCFTTTRVQKPSFGMINGEVIEPIKY